MLVSSLTAPKLQNALHLSIAAIEYSMWMPSAQSNVTDGSSSFCSTRRSCLFA
jgi:hypothetical protein